jgi:tape measure domain-containing protein
VPEPIGEATVTVTADASGFGADIQSKGKQILGKVGGVLGDALSTGLKTTAAAASAAIGTIMGISLAKGFGRLEAIDTAKGKLDGLGYSAEQVEGIMKDALASVKGTAFGLGDAAGLAASMLAAGVAPGEDLTRTLKLMGDTATIAGVGLGEMGNVFGDVAASGKLTGDSLFQLQDRGIPVLQWLAKQYGVTSEEAKKMVKEGKVSFADFQTAIEANIGGAALKSGDTFKGGLANVQAALGRLGASALDPGFQMLKGIFQSAIPAVDSLTAGMKPLFEMINSKMVPAVTSLAEKFFGFISKVDFSKLGSGLSGISELIIPLVGAFSGLLGPLLSQIPVIGSLFSGLSGPVGLVIGLLISMFKESESLRTALGDIAGVFGEAFKSAGPLLTNLSSAFGEIARIVGNVLAQALQAAMPLFEMLAGVITDIGPDMKPLVGVFASLAKILGTVLTAALEVVTPLIELVVDGLKILMPVIRPILGLIQTLASAFSAILGAALVAIMPLLDMIIYQILPALMPVITQIIGFVTQFAASLGGFLVSAIQLLLPPLVQLVMSVLPIFVQVLNSLMPILDALMPLIQAVFEVWINLVTALMPVVQALLPVVTTVFTVIASVIKAAVGIITAIINTLLAFLRGDWKAVWEGVKQILQATWDTLKAIVTGAIEIIKSVISSVINAIKALWNSVWTAIGTKVTEIWNTIKTAVSTAIENVKTKISEGLAGAKAAWDKMWSELGAGIAGIWEGIKSGVATGIAAVGTAITGVKDTVVSFFSNAGSWLLEAGKRIIGGLIDGVKSMIGGIGDAIGNIASTVTDFLPFSPAKEGPLSGRGDTHFSGKAIVRGLSEGIAGQEDELVNSIAGVMAGAADALTVDASVPLIPTGLMAGASATPAAAGTVNNNYDIVVTVPLSDLAQLNDLEQFMDMLRVRVRMGVGFSG